jgi:RNA polymerase sigma-70 factor (ECF subfamily)
VQEAFVQAVRKRASFKFEAPLEAWVWRIVINEALALRRSRASEFERASESATTPSTNHVPEQDATVRTWVASLPERQRLAVFLRYFADLDYQSIAIALEVEVGTVSATLATAHAALRRSYEEAVRWSTSHPAALALAGRRHRRGDGRGRGLARHAGARSR